MDAESSGVKRSNLQRLDSIKSSKPSSSYQDQSSKTSISGSLSKKLKEKHISKVDPSSKSVQVTNVKINSGKTRPVLVDDGKSQGNGPTSTSKNVGIIKNYSKDYMSHSASRIRQKSIILSKDGKIKKHKRKKDVSSHSEHIGLSLGTMETKTTDSHPKELEFLPLNLPQNPSPSLPKVDSLSTNLLVSRTKPKPKQLSSPHRAPGELLRKDHCPKIPTKIRSGYLSDYVSSKHGVPLRIHKKVRKSLPSNALIANKHGRERTKVKKNPTCVDMTKPKSFKNFLKLSASKDHHSSVAPICNGKTDDHGVLSSSNGCSSPDDIDSVWLDDKIGSQVKNVEMKSSFSQPCAPTVIRRTARKSTGGYKPNPKAIRRRQLCLTLHKISLAGLKLPRKKNIMTDSIKKKVVDDGSCSDSDAVKSRKHKHKRELILPEMSDSDIPCKKVRCSSSDLTSGYSKVDQPISDDASSMTCARVVPMECFFPCTCSRTEPYSDSKEKKKNLAHQNSNLNLLITSTDIIGTDVAGCSTSLGDVERSTMRQSDTNESHSKTKPAAHLHENISIPKPHLVSEHDVSSIDPPFFNIDDASLDDNEPIKSPNMEQVSDKSSVSSECNGLTDEEGLDPLPLVDEEYSARLQETISRIAAETGMDFQPNDVSEPTKRRSSDDVESQLLVKIELNKLLHPPAPLYTSGVITRTIGTSVSIGVQVDRGIIVDKDVLDSYLSVKLNESLYEMKDQLLKTENKVKMVMKEKEKLEITLREKVQMIRDLMAGKRPALIDQDTMTDETITRSHVSPTSPASTKSKRKSAKSISTQTDLPAEKNNFCLKNSTDENLIRYVHPRLDSPKPSPTPEPELDTDGTIAVQNAKKDWMFGNMETCARCHAIRPQVRLLRALKTTVNPQTVDASWGATSDDVGWNSLGPKLQNLFKQLYGIYIFLEPLPIEPVLVTEINKVKERLQHVLSHLPIPKSFNQTVDDTELNHPKTNAVATFLLGWKLKELIELLDLIYGELSMLPLYFKAEMNETLKTTESALKFAMEGMRNVSLRHGDHGFITNSDLCWESEPSGLPMRSYECAPKGLVPYFKYELNGLEDDLYGSDTSDSLFSSSSDSDLLESEGELKLMRQAKKKKSMKQLSASRRASVSSPRKQKGHTIEARKKPKGSILNKTVVSKKACATQTSSRTTPYQYQPKKSHTSKVPTSQSVSLMSTGISSIAPQSVSTGLFSTTSQSVSPTTSATPQSISHTSAGLPSATSQSTSLTSTSVSSVIPQSVSPTSISAMPQIVSLASTGVSSATPQSASLTSTGVSSVTPQSVSPTPTGLSSLQHIMSDKQARISYLHALTRAVNTKINNLLARSGAVPNKPIACRPISVSHSPIQQQPRAVLTSCMPVSIPNKTSPTFIHGRVICSRLSPKQFTSLPSILSRPTLLIASTTPSTVPDTQLASSSTKVSQGIKIGQLLQSSPPSGIGTKDLAPTSALDAKKSLSSTPLCTLQSSVTSFDSSLTNMNKKLPIFVYNPSSVSVVNSIKNCTMSVSAQKPSTQSENALSSSNTVSTPSNSLLTHSKANTTHESTPLTTTLTDATPTTSIVTSAPPSTIASPASDSTTTIAMSSTAALPTLTVSEELMQRNISLLTSTPSTLSNVNTTSVSHSPSTSANIVMDSNANNSTLSTNAMLTPANTLVTYFNKLLSASGTLTPANTFVTRSNVNSTQNRAANSLVTNPSTSANLTPVNSLVTHSNANSLHSREPSTSATDNSSSNASMAVTSTANTLVTHSNVNSTQNRIPSTSATLTPAVMHSNANSMHNREPAILTSSTNTTLMPVNSKYADLTVPSTSSTFVTNSGARSTSTNSMPANSHSNANSIHKQKLSTSTPLVMHSNANSSHNGVSTTNAQLMPANSLVTHSNANLTHNETPSISTTLTPAVTAPSTSANLIPTSSHMIQSSANSATSTTLMSANSLVTHSRAPSTSIKLIPANSYITRSTTNSVHNQAPSTLKPANSPSNNSLSSTNLIVNRTITGTPVSGNSVHKATSTSIIDGCAPITILKQQQCQTVINTASTALGPPVVAQMCVAQASQRIVTYQVATNLIQLCSRIQPELQVSKSDSSPGIVLKWTLPSEYLELQNRIHSYKIYAVIQESGQLQVPHTEKWKCVGEVAPLQLPMAVTLSNFCQGTLYLFVMKAYFNRPGVSSQFSNVCMMQL